MAVGADTAGLGQRRGLRIEITGVVQGVGFRPFVYRLAHQYELTGWVRNTSAGVEIEAEGEATRLDAFVHGLRHEAPPMARIETLRTAPIPANGFQSFSILHSHELEGAYQLVSPDVATCADCRRELFDPQDRRYRYPFTNCTNCGPRFTIIESIPYDRPRTTMRAFPMCPQCQAEYDDPLNRRFHAQPNACPVCGPHLTLCDAQGRPIAERDEALRRSASMLAEGAIVALKGLGGFQLACDATNGEAVARLRQRKHRPDKPFAVMLQDLTAAEEHARLSDAERELLSSSRAPIVLARWREAAGIAADVAPRQHTLGLMLPYTPLHHLLLADVARPLVMTSGNLSEEPIAQDNDEALRRLAGIADHFLMHNRGIHSRYDDSVWFVPRGGPQPVRRARGYAPDPIKLAFKARPILACGAELKNTFCLTRDVYAFVSQHIGDMENLETLTHWQNTLTLYRELFACEPEIVAHDMHPDYLVTRAALDMPGRKVAVQHHHAHLAACLADAGHEGPVIGLILDGTGYGLDGHIWGGEVLLGDARGFQRAARLEYLPLPGSDQATRHPYRIALAYLEALGLAENLPESLAWVPVDERRNLKIMLSRGVNTPLTSSAGRLFDAVAALLGIGQSVSYEGQAAMELEQAALIAGGSGEDDKTDAYRLEWDQEPGVLSWGDVAPCTSITRNVRVTALLRSLLADLAAGLPTGEIAWRFHAGLAAGLARLAAEMAAESGLRHVALSGGCFQNRLLLELLVPRLEAAGLCVLLHRQVPCNDGGLSLGQAIVAHHLVEGD